MGAQQKRKEAVNSVADSSVTAPETESIERQEERVVRAEVPEPMPGCSTDEDFQ